jgi:hypothetical protein
MPRPAALTLALAILFLTGMYAAPAEASHGLVPGLSGEQLEAVGFATSPSENGLFISGTCDPTGRSTFTYNARGSAQGPYSAGIFEESGTFTLGPIIDPPEGHPAGELLRFSARFTITTFAPRADIQGSKALRHGDVSSGATCSASGTVAVAVTGLRYRASIETLEFGERCRDKGISTVALDNISFGSFRETFGSEYGFARCSGPSKTTGPTRGSPSP